MKEINTHIKISSLIKALLIIIIVIFGCAIIMGTVAYFSQWIITKQVLIVANYLGIFGGAFYAGRNSSEKLWLNGMIVGILYYLMITLIFGNIGIAIITWSWIKQLLIVSGVGLLGGVVSGFIK